MFAFLFREEVAHFNPHICAEYDISLIAKIFFVWYFNPRTRVERDWQVNIMLLFVHFNPRIHVGYDDEVGTKMALNSRFQSTQPRRVRLSQIVFMTCLKNISNHTLSQDATVECCKAGYIRFISIHTSTRDVTSHLGRYGAPGEFQSTHPRRLRPVNYSWRCQE